MQLARLRQLEMTRQIVEGALDLQRQPVEHLLIGLMGTGEAGEPAELTGEAEPSPMKDQQLQLLSPRLPEQHAHRLIRLVEGRHGQLVADDGLQGGHAVDRVRQLLHPRFGHADHVDARPTRRGRRQVHIVHGELQHGFVDKILDGPGQGPRHLGVGHGGLVDLDLLIKAGGQGHPHLRLGQAMLGKQLPHGPGPVVRTMDGATGKDRDGFHTSQQDAIAGQQESHLRAGVRTSEK